MMLKQTSDFNIEASLNASLNAAIAAFLLPAWLPTRPTLVFIPEDIPLSVPCFSVYHIPVDSDDRYQGRRADGTDKVTRDSALMEVSAWVTRVGTPYWLPQLRTMRDMVKHWHNQHPQVVVQDYAASLSAPTATSYKINLDGITPTPQQQDTANPDLWRVRMLVAYDWVYRA